MNRLVITDSTADIPPETAKEHGIEVLPVNVVLDGKTYRDGVDINPADFYENYDTYKTMHTEAIPYQDYALRYMRLTQDYDEILIVHCSSELSDNYKTACKVRDEFQKHQCKVEIIDSRSCSMGFGLTVVEAAKAFKVGMDLNRVVKEVNYALQQTVSYLTIPTLKYLRKRKKIGGFKSLLGLTLGAKPVLGFVDGRLEVKTKLFGKQPNMILSMLGIIKSDIGKSPIKLAIVHGRDTSTVKSLKEVFEYNFICREIHQAYFGPSITINAGPEAIGVMFSKQAN